MPKSQAAEPEHRVMWLNGPTRRFSETHHPLATMPLDSGGYGGSYCCQVDDKPCDGVYIAKSNSEHAGKWICGGCRNAEIEKNAVPRKSRKIA